MGNAVSVASADSRGARERDSWRPAADAAMDRYARGDDAAFSALYELLAPRLYAFLERRTRDPGHAEDILQQTFLQIHGARRRFVAGAAVMPWAFAIARRLLLDRCRYSKHNARLTAVEREAMEVPASDVPPDEMAGLRALAEQLETVLAELPEHHRIALELVRFEGLSIAEAAGVLGTTATAVKMRVHRAYSALRKKLGPIFFDGPWTLRVNRRPRASSPHLRAHPEAAGTSASASARP